MLSVLSPGRCHLCDYCPSTYTYRTDCRERMGIGRSYGVYMNHRREQRTRNSNHTVRRSGGNRPNTLPFTTTTATIIITTTTDQRAKPSSSQPSLTLLSSQSAKPPLSPS